MTSKHLQEDSKQRIPKLRFPVFNGDWEEKELGDVVTFLKGKGISKDDIARDGKNKCIRYGELYTEYGEIISTIKSKTNVSERDSLLSKSDDLLIPSSGETAIDIATSSCLKEDDVLLGGDMNVLRFKEPQSSEFYAYYLSNYQRMKIAKTAQGYSVVHLYASQLKKLNINRPSFDEQQKIASFLLSVDRWIEILREQKASLLEYKVGMMQNIFAENIRFNNGQGEDFPAWEEKSLGELVSFFRGGSLSKSDLKSTGQYRCIHYGELFTAYGEVIETVRSRTDIDVGVEGRIGDILMPTSDVTPQGLAKASSLQTDHVKLGGDINILRPHPSVNSVLLSYLINFQKKKIMAIVNGTTVRHVYAKDIRKLKYSIPSDLEEQRKIAELLVSIDEMIGAKGRQIIEAKNWKKGLLQKLFV